MRPPVAEGMLLIGDAAGLAYSESGEGIGPAVKSARLAADAITHAAGRFSADDLAPYARRIAPAMADGPFRRIRVRMPAALGRLALSSAGLTRLALDRWFLRRHERIGSPSERHVAA